MRLECEKLEECEATPELIRELVRNGAKRGEFMIMMRDDDEESYVQVACDFDEVGGADDGCFDLEYREGAKSPFERTAAMKRWHKAVERVRDWAQN